MSTTLLVIHVLFVAVCAGCSYAAGWVRGVRDHADMIEEQKSEDNRL